MAYFGSIQVSTHAYFYPLFLDTQRLLDGCDDLPAVQESNSVHARHLHALTGAQLFNYLDQFQCLVGKPCKELRNNFYLFLIVRVATMKLSWMDSVCRRLEVGTWRNWLQARFAKIFLWVSRMNEIDRHVRILFRMHFQSLLLLSDRNHIIVWRTVAWFEKTKCIQRRLPWQTTDG